jgi:hypothetical protein
MGNSIDGAIFLAILIQRIGNPLPRYGMPYIGLFGWKSLEIHDNPLKIYQILHFGESGATHRIRTCPVRIMSSRHFHYARVAESGLYHN